MHIKTFSPFSFFTIICMVITISVAACVPTATLEPGTTVEPATPTPEIFNPLDPSPTPSNSTLPLTCQVTDLNVYVNEAWGYCFVYSTNFTVDESLVADGISLQPALPGDHCFSFLT